MALSVRGSGTAVTDGSAQVLSDAGALEAAVAVLDAAALVSGDELAVRWRVSVGGNVRTVWETTVVADGTQEGVLTPPIPLSAANGELAIEQTAGTTGKSIPWMVMNL